MKEQMDLNLNESLEESSVQATTKEETDKKCPSCNGVMDFDPATGGLKCPYCGHLEEIPVEKEAEGPAEELDFNEAEATGNCYWGRETKVVICKSCGAESVYDALQIAGECPYCGSNQVMEEKGINTLAPGGVVPFKIDQEKAGFNFKIWIKGKLFCPKEAKIKAKPSSFKGVYIPFWTFDAQTSSHYSARYGKYRRVKDKDGKVRTETDWYNTSGHHSQFINDQLILGSTQHDEYLLRGIEPFNTEDNVAYKPEYIAGFASERYSIGLKDAWERAKDFIKDKLIGSVTSKIRREKNADTVASVNLSTTYSDVTYKYLLLPVWMSSFKYKGKVYKFIVNGQTGKVAGKIPISPLRVAIAVIIGIVLIALFLYFFNGQ